MPGARQKLAAFTLETAPREALHGPCFKEKETKARRGGGNAPGSPAATEGNWERLWPLRLKEQNGNTFLYTRTMRADRARPRPTLAARS